jgi:hypothetical protein
MPSTIHRVRVMDYMASEHLHCFRPGIYGTLNRLPTFDQDWLTFSAVLIKLFILDLDDLPQIVFIIRTICTWCELGVMQFDA